MDESREGMPPSGGVTPTSGSATAKGVAGRSIGGPAITGGDHLLGAGDDGFVGRQYRQVL